MSITKDAESERVKIIKIFFFNNIIRYMRLRVPEVVGTIIDSSEHRMAAICRHPAPKKQEDVLKILSDQTDPDYRVYQEIKEDDYVKTIATGNRMSKIFYNLCKKFMYNFYSIVCIH